MDQLADLVEGITLEPTALLDIALTAILIYGLISLIQGTRAMRLVIGAVVLYVIYLLAQALDLRMLSGFMQTGAVVALLALVVVFQPELRRALERLGQFGSLGWVGGPGGTRATAERVARTLARTASTMAAQRVGALIVVERESSLDDAAETGVMLHAVLTEELLAAIFMPGGALHDGAVIVRDDRILAAGVVLPLSDGSVTRERLGTRHRAAMGVTDQTDALAVVVSEETGRISLADHGRLLRDLDEERLRSLLVEALRPPDRRRAAGIGAIGRGTFAPGKRPRVLRRRGPSGRDSSGAAVPGGAVTPATAAAATDAVATSPVTGRTE